MSGNGNGLCQGMGFWVRCEGMGFGCSVRQGVLCAVSGNGFWWCAV